MGLRSLGYLGIRSRISPPLLWPSRRRIPRYGVHFPPVHDGPGERNEGRGQQRHLSPFRVSHHAPRHSFLLEGGILRLDQGIFLSRSPQRFPVLRTQRLDFRKRGPQVFLLRPFRKWLVPLFLQRLRIRFFFRRFAQQQLPQLVQRLFL